MSRTPTFKPAEFAEHLTKTGDYCIANDDLFHWTGAYWKQMTTRESESTALKWIMSDGCYLASSTNAKAALATAMLLIEAQEDSDNISVVPVLNGYVHFDECGVTLKPHDRALGIRHIINCEYDPAAATASEFEKFITCILPDPAVRARVQEYFGYTLLPDAREQFAQFWIGSGANGKGVLANILQALHRKTAAIRLDNLDGFNLTEIVNASLIYCDEAPQGKLNSDVFKIVTAEERVQINRRYKDPISVNIHGKWLILGNHIPEITDHSEGFWRRLDIVPFDVTVAKADRDPRLAKRIIAHELAGVLNWALEGVVRLLDRGKFDPVLPPAMARALQIAMAESDPVRTWSLDRDIGLMTTCDTPKADVYSNYANWCRANGCVADSSIKFWRRFPTIFTELKEARIQTRAGYQRACNVRL